MKLNLFCFLQLLLIFSLAQVGINTNLPNATLDVVSSATDTSIPDGIIPPRISKLNLVNKSATTYTSNQTGAVVYINDVSGATTDTRLDRVINQGYYYFSGMQWIPFQTPWIPLTNFNGDRSGVYLYSFGDGKERGLREKINFLDNGRIGFGTNTPSSRLHLSNMRESTETPSNAVIAEKAIFTIESFGGTPLTSLKSAPLIRMIQSRGIGTGGDVKRPDNADSMGGIEYVAANGSSTGTSALTAAKIDVKFKLDNTTGGQKNTADIFFTTSDWAGTAHSLTTRMAILGDGKVGINTSMPTTNLYVQGSSATSMNNETVNLASNISVLGKSTIFISVNSGTQSIILTDGVAGQRIVIVNTSNTNFLTVSNAAGIVTISPNKGTQLVYNGTQWYSLS